MISEYDVTRATKHRTNDINVRYLFQKDNERGFSERQIFKDALMCGVIEESFYDDLARLYKSRNRVVHRYIISNIKTRDVMEISQHYLTAAEQVRKTLRKFEDKQKDSPYGVYGKRFKRGSIYDEEAVRNLFSAVNDKHALQKLTRRIERDKT